MREAEKKLGFTIRFLPGETEARAAAGQLVLGAETEGFHAELGYWSREDYERQWQGSLSGLVHDQAAAACLVTSIPPLEHANFVFWWVLYVVGSDVAIQQQILFLEELDAPFDPESPERSIRERTTISEDGDPISEWVVPLDSVRAFLRLRWPASEAAASRRLTPRARKKPG